jgi:hypothetical protein
MELDHIVIAVTDLAAAAGVEVRHGLGRSRRAASGLGHGEQDRAAGDTYLEPSR